MMVGAAVVAVSAGQFLDGLLGNEPRKTGWMRAAAAGGPGPRTVGCGGVARHRARVRAGNAGRRGRGSGHELQANVA
jgi:hypothetical protein